MKADLDLFGNVAGPAPKRIGRRVHLPWAVRAKVETLRREGASGAEIAKALGISEATVWSRLGAELERGWPGGRQPGRHTWKPSSDDRAKVVKLTAEGASVDRVAEILGVSAPTLRLHCRADLVAGRRARGGQFRRSAGRDPTEAPE